MAEFVVAITGASGAAYGLGLIRSLAGYGHTVHVVVSKGGARVLKHECNLSINPKAPDEDVLFPVHPERLRPHSFTNYGATVASGSYPVDGMAICPASMGTIGRVAAGTGENLVARAADVCLKEGRRLVVVPREAPLSLVQLRNLVTLREAGAVVLPASPGFYHAPQSVDDLVDFVVARCMEQLGVEQRMIDPWQG